MRSYKDVIGNALAWPGGYTLFGEDAPPAGPMMGPGPGMVAPAVAAMAPQAFGFQYPGWCGAPGADFMSRHPNRWLKTIAVGPQCGPGEVEMIIGSDFSPTETVAAQGSITVRFIPQIPLFKAYRLGVPSSIGTSWVLTSLQGANQNLLAGAGTIPCLALSETARGNWLNGVTVVGNQPLIAQFLNISGQESNFYAWCSGVGVSAGGVQIYGGPHAQ